jgi:hypothetical protein
MLHACVERFDVMGGRGNILGWDREVNKAQCVVPKKTQPTIPLRSLCEMNLSARKKWANLKFGFINKAAQPNAPGQY